MIYFPKKNLIIFFLSFAVAIGLWFYYLNGGFSLFLEKINRETPEEKITVYINAVRKSDETQALNLWKLPEWESWKSDPKKSLLEKRRNDMTKELIAKKVKSFNIEKTEWWRTCCEPAIIDDYREAGGARIQVRIIDQNNQSNLYIFDVFIEDNNYSGATEGYPVRNWLLRDIYLSDQEPLFWTIKR